MSTRTALEKARACELQVGMLVRHVTGDLISDMATRRTVRKTDVSPISTGIRGDEVLCIAWETASTKQWCHKIRVRQMQYRT